MGEKVYVVMTEMNGYKNLLSVWKHQEDALKVVDYIRKDGTGRDAYCIKMPVHDMVYI